MRFKPKSILTEEKCKFGCNNKATHITKSGGLICNSSPNACPENKRKNSSGLKSSGRDWKAVYKSISSDSKDKMNWNKGNRTADFSYDGKGNHKGVLICQRGHQCETCLLTEWLGEPITLELEHVDGVSRNNSIENLQLLCPNCHSQTTTWKGRNKTSFKSIIPDSTLIDNIDKGLNNRQVLIQSGLTGKGRNYIRVNRIRAQIAQSEGGI